MVVESGMMSGATATTVALMAATRVTPCQTGPFSFKGSKAFLSKALTDSPKIIHVSVLISCIFPLVVFKLFTRVEGKRMVDNLCDEFKLNPARNPRTGRPIKRGGPVYRALEQECRDDPPINGRESVTDLCTEFRLDPTRNPRTGRQIKAGGAVYRALEKECEDEPAGAGAGGQPNSPGIGTCAKFKLNPAVNPRTGRQIKKGGKVYKELELECDEDVDYSNLHGYQTTECDQFYANPTKNPKTGRPISPRGKVYRELLARCGPVPQPENGVGSEQSYANRAPSPRRRAAGQDSDRAYRNMSTCERFMARPNFNPVTGEPLRLSDPLYADLVAVCGDPRTGAPPLPPPKESSTSNWSDATSLSTSDKTMCELFCEYPGFDPLTNERMMPNSAEYKMYKELCDCDGSSSSGGSQSPGGSARAAKVEEARSSGADAEKDLANLGTESVTTGKRAREMEIVVRHLKSIPPTNGGFCATGDVQWLKDWALSDKIVGEGSWGSVHLVVIKGLDLKFALKESLLVDDADKRRFKPTPSWDDWKKGSKPEEAKINDLVTFMATKNATPFVPMTAGAGSCDKCQPSLYQRTVKPSKCYLQAIEAADCSLDKLLPTMPADQAASALAQVLLGLQALQTQLGMIHLDIKSHNVLVKKIKPGGYWKVTDSVNGQTFYVPNRGHLCMLADFGVVLMAKPEHNISQYYGTRQAMLTQDTGAKWGKEAGKEFTLTPFSTKMEAERFLGVITGSRINKTVRYWKAKENGKVLPDPYTNNFFAKGINHMPSIPVDLNDTGKFPCWEWRGCVADCVRMFVGGDRTTQMGHHAQLYHMQGTSWEKAATIIAKQNVTHSAYILDGSGLKYMRGGTACAYIFPEMANRPAGQPMIEDCAL
ncbi:putative 2-cysteine adaptor domain protein [Mandarin fish ranavirus]|uniref:Protein kinase domain-containing protein n=1 Tax=Largemouth bass virus TaxID=176656 RepID=A0A9E7PRC1_9VIRU|nr:putative 2-cysteine adaptor domain protein [Mandarin fish ranavirus]UUY86260.1 hypothetical protein [Largemouth bass virus]WHA35573.1 hypothetical protein MSRaV_86R [Micropterus salmoides ranavirus]